jgi:hypothetical protein
MVVADKQLTHEIIEANREARRLDHQRAVRIERAASADLLVFVAIVTFIALVAWMVAR